MREQIVIIEMRTYRARPGRRDEFLRIFRSRMIPAQVEGGMKILGPFLSIDDPDTFFFLRGFPSRRSHEPMKAKFHDGELWRNELKPVLLPMLDNVNVVVVEDADGVIRW
jgi:NIPSNAP